MQRQLLVFSLCVTLTLSLNSLTFFGNNIDLIPTDAEFSNFYLKNGNRVSLNASEGDVYFPKCCPPNFQYEPVYRKCVSTNQSAPIYDDLNLQVNLVKSGMKECEVIVDYVISEVEFEEQVDFSNTTLIFRREDRFNLGNYCLDRDVISRNVVLRLCYSKNYCTNPRSDHKRCLKKCCPDGHSYKNRCQLNPTIGINVLDHEDVIHNARDEFAIWYETRGCVKYKADKNKHVFYIDEKGSFFVRELGEMKEYKIDETMYCIEERVTSKKSGPDFFLCAISNKNDIKFLISRPTMIISSIFLLLTIMIFLFRSQTSTIMDKVMISYCFAMLGAYLSLTIIQFQVYIGSCEFMGYSTLFFFIATFTWMNVLCFDIWQNLRRSSCTNKIFLKYNLYAWTTPTILTLLVFIINYCLPLPSHLHPFLGETRCTLENRIPEASYGYLIFFVIPSAASIMFNVVLFIMCIRVILEKYKEFSRIDKEENLTSSTRTILTINRQRFSTILKLSLIMGINWSFEIISSVINFKGNNVLKTIELIIDTFNCLQGLFIFVIFHYGLLVHIINRCRGKERKTEEVDSEQ